MQGTRDRILEIIVERGELRVEELSRDLGITAAAVRRHLDHLRADGLVDARSVKQTTGRPYHVYYATELATGEMPAAYAGLMERMLKSLESRHETQDVAKVVGESLASRYSSEVDASGSAEQKDRIESVTASLREEGILQRWYSSADGYHLVNEACPYLKAAEISELPCESDHKAIEVLLGESITQVGRIVDGASCCEYVVPLEAGTSGEVTTTDE
jgi:DeoR family transcriptional regulator, suf operon transcriptional repressor